MTTPLPKSKRETLLSRSRRIIGKQMRDDSASQGEPRSKIADDFTPNQHSSNVGVSVNGAPGEVSKRRAQVLKAQRVHRRRTQNYIQELEKEVLRLRAREADLQLEIDSKSSSAASKGQSTGPTSPSFSVDSGEMEHVLSGSSVTVDLTSYTNEEAKFSCIVDAALGSAPAYTVPSSDIASNLKGLDIGDERMLADKVFATDTQAAIDFILDLEKPCLPHVKSEMMNNTSDQFGVPVFNYGLSHSCTASATLIHSHRDTDFEARKFQVPIKEVERLLESSKALPLGPEMTPVQVWSIIVSISTCQPISINVLNSLQEELRKYMRCNSFGTTVEIDTLRSLLNYFFPWYATEHLHDNLRSVQQGGREQMESLVGPNWEEYF